MTLNIAREIASLERMTVKELRERHIEVFGQSNRSGHKAYLVKRIAWRIQANARGDLAVWARRIRQRADELANDADLRTTAPKVKAPPADTPASVATTMATFAEHDARLPMVGGSLRRPYKGQEIVVRVLPNGFEWEGQVYRSLSAVAKAVTGKHWNGYHFFNITPRNAPRNNPGTAPGMKKPMPKPLNPQWNGPHDDSIRQQNLIHPRAAMRHLHPQEHRRRA